MIPPTPWLNSVAPIRSGATACTLRAKKRRSSNADPAMRVFLGSLPALRYRTRARAPGGPAGAQGEGGPCPPSPRHYRVRGVSLAPGERPARGCRPIARLRKCENLWRIGNTSETFQPHRGENAPTPRFGHTVLGDDKGQKKLPCLFGFGSA